MFCLVSPVLTLDATSFLIDSDTSHWVFRAMDWNWVWKAFGISWWNCCHTTRFPFLHRSTRWEVAWLCCWNLWGSFSASWSWTNRYSWLLLDLTWITWIVFIKDSPVTIVLLYVYRCQRSCCIKRFSCTNRVVWGRIAAWIHNCSEVWWRTLYCQTRFLSIQCGCLAWQLRAL